MNDIIYWEQFYTQHRVSMEESNFAHFCINNFFHQGDTIVEFGCGNGKDALFFAQQGVHVLAIDQCMEEISYLSQHHTHPHIQFMTGDFSQFPLTANTYNAVYSRFTLHSITPAQENAALLSAYNALQHGGYLCIEARGLHNEYYGKGIALDEQHAFIYEEHYRRFIDRDILYEKLISLGFTVLFADEAKGRAKYKNQNHTFLRAIAIK